MTDLAEAANRLNTTALRPLTPIEELRRRADRRRQRRRHVRAMACAAASVLVIASVAIALNMSHHHRPPVVVTRPGPSTARTVPPLVVIDPPGTLYVHFLRSGNVPGAIEELTTANGHDLSDVGSYFDPYVGDGFHAGPGNTLYWTHLDQPSQKLPVTQLTDNRNPRVVGFGATDLPSPDGNWLVVSGGQKSPLELVDVAPVGHLTSGLASDEPRTIPQPPAHGEGLASLAWLPDSLDLVGITDAISPTCTAPLGVACPTTAAPPPAPEAWIIDIRSPGAGWHQIPTPAGGWQNTTLLGPGRLAGTVLAVTSPATSGDGHWTARTVDVATGSVIDNVPLPATVTSVLGSDHTGTNLLVTVDRYNQLDYLALGEPVPQTLAFGVAEATWW